MPKRRIPTDFRTSSPACNTLAGANGRATLRSALPLLYSSYVGRIGEFGRETPRRHGPGRCTKGPGHPQDLRATGRCSKRRPRPHSPETTQAGDDPAWRRSVGLIGMLVFYFAPSTTAFGFSMQRLARVPTMLAVLIVVSSCLPAPVNRPDGPRNEASAAREERRPPENRSYHVQVRTVESKSDADRAVSEVMDWYASLSAARRPPILSDKEQVPVDVRWKPPFYRVRLGPFETEEEARSVLGIIQESFPKAFIAREISAPGP